MKKTQETSVISAELIGLMQQLHVLTDVASRLEKRIIEMPIIFNQGKTAKSITNFHSVGENPESKTTDKTSKIIPFPGIKNPAYGSNFVICSGMESGSSQTKQFFSVMPFLAMPGKPLPSEIHDYRLILQRDGLILLAWDKRVTETGERYTAYWVTSNGIPRFYASRPLLLKDFPSARPNHKSYAAEDGIEFYGQQAPVYIIHVAPELMMSNPMHSELRAIHIEKLRKLGSKVNFNYKYLLKTEKGRKAPPKKTDDGPQNCAG